MRGDVQVVSGETGLLCGNGTGGEPESGAKPEKNEQWAGSR